MIRFTLTLAALAAAALAPTPSAQTTVVDYDDSALASPPDFGYPFYTPGAGSQGRSVRVQYRCPHEFAGLPTTPMLCTKVGLQLAGTATYGTFEIRAGVSTMPALGSIWAQNLPDQRVQYDLNDEPLSFGAAAQWVEFDLAYPFVYTPGQSVVVDLTTNIRSVGQFLSTALTTNPSERLVDDDYQGLPVGPAPRTSGGLKFRLVMEPLGSFSTYGDGCSGLGGFTPEIGASGVANVGNGGFSVDLANSRPGAPSAFLLGSARGLGASIPLPQAFGGGCLLLMEPDLLTVTTAALGTTAGTGTATALLPIPNDPSLQGAVLFAQWAQVDDQASNPFGVTFSRAGVFSIL